MKEFEYLSHIFPSGLLDHFTIVGFEEIKEKSSDSTYFEIKLKEKNVILGDIDGSLYESKGFTEVVLQHFPIRGKATFLCIQRRRWRLKSDKKITHRNDFPFAVTASGFTKEFSNFLKLMIETRIDTITNISSNFGVKSYKLNFHYKKKVSGFETWPQKPHAKDFLIFEENIGQNLRVDEVFLTKGEVYTFVFNTAAHGNKGTLVAVIAGTKAEFILEILEKIALEKRNEVREITLDKAKNIKSCLKNAFPNAKLMNNKFNENKLELVETNKIKRFYTVTKTANNDSEDVLDFFDNNNNTHSESFINKIKLFLTDQRGVLDIQFFMFRLYKLFA